MNVWMYGGGVQSCAIAALIAKGSIEPPDIAVIADTGMEQSTTWKYLESIIQPILSFKIHRVLAKDYATVGVWGGKDKKSILIPAFTTRGGNIGKLPGYCSNEWKKRVIDRWLSARGIKGGVKWFGFSTDELKRIKKDSGKWTGRYPLVEQRMNRGDCQALAIHMGWPNPPRSSCWMCPNHLQEEWRDIRDNKPEDWAKAIAFDESIRSIDKDIWVHSDATPLKEADLDDRNESMFERCDSGICFI